MQEGMPNRTSSEVVRGNVLTGGLVLGRAGLFLGIKIDFRQLPFVCQHKGFSRIVAIDVNRFGRLVSNADSVMVLGTRYRDFYRQLHVPFSPKFPYLTVNDISNQSALFVKGLQPR